MDRLTRFCLGMTLKIFVYCFWMAAGSLLTIGVMKNKVIPVVEQITLEDKLIGTDKAPYEQEGYHPVVRLINEDKKFICSGYVADKHYIVTAAHCLKNSSKELMDGKVLIEDNKGKIIGEGVAAGISFRVDIGIIYGDFSKFKILASEFYQDGFRWPYPKHHYIACGYPAGQRIEACVPFFPGVPGHDEYMGFTRFGVSTIIPGMSGGPVINKSTGRVVGVNSSARSGGGSMVAPMLGLPGTFGIEP